MNNPDYYRINQYSKNSSLTILGNIKDFVSFEECMKKMNDAKKSNPVQEISIEYFFA